MVPTGPRHSRALRRAGVLTRRWCGKGGADTTPLVIMTVSYTYPITGSESRVRLLIFADP